MRHHVFLSYSRKDTEVMQRLRHDLNMAGLTIWTDEGIEPGTSSWKRAIESAILDAGCLVAILSPDASQSQWVRAELDFAELQVISIFLILARGEERTSIPFGFAASQWVDIRDSNQYIPGIQRLIATIQKRLESVPDSPAPTSSAPTIANLLLPPFEWCDIPPGSVKLGDASQYEPPGTKGSVFQVESFHIAKYPATNVQYQAFVDASDGYRDSKWWDFSAEAKTWRNKNPQPQPTTFEGDDRPRTNVTWYEAIAFCRWLSSQSGQTITLPTEQQWQRAAQGDDNRRFPWGNEVDEARCNFNSRETTPVDYYPTGASPYGVMDMCGNVWEWCLTEWGTDSVELNGGNIRVLRGCSYYENRANRLLVNYRSGGNPPDRNFFTGFRIARIN